MKAIPVMYMTEHEWSRMKQIIQRTSGTHYTHMFGLMRCTIQWNLEIVTEKCSNNTGRGITHLVGRR